MAKEWRFYDSGGVLRKVKEAYFYDSGGARRKIKEGHFYDSAGNRRQFFSSGIQLPITMNSADGPSQYDGYSKNPPLADTFGSIVPASFTAIGGYELVGVIRNSLSNQLLVYFYVPSMVDPGVGAFPFTNFYTGLGGTDEVRTKASATYGFSALTGSAKFEWNNLGAKYLVRQYNIGFDV